MTNILVEGYSHIPSFDLSVRDFNRFSSILPIRIRSKLTKEISPKDIQWCDVLVCIRGNNTLSEYLAKQAIKAGRKLILVIDDDLIDYKSKPHNYLDKLYSKSVQSIFQYSNYILTTSRYLGDKYKKKYGKDYILTDTIVEESELFPIYKRNDDVVKMVYAAGSAHMIFFNSYIKPILNMLYERYHEKLSITIVGPDIDMEGVSLKYEKVPSMPLRQYMQYMEEHHFDIGLAPLIDSEFCRSKYYNKYIEYSKYGICGVYSNVIPYNEVVQDGANGILASNTPDDWLNAICRVVDDKKLQYDCTFNAQNKLICNHSLNNIASRLTKAIPELVKFKAGKCSAFPFKFMYGRYLILAMQRKIQVLLNE